MIHASALQWFRVWGLRFIGLALLFILIIQADIGRLFDSLQSANLTLVGVAIGTILPMIYTKAVRWLYILESQSIQYNLRSAFLSYLGSMYIGLLTPGRLGEFVKALHVSRDCNISSARAFSSVLIDRFYDLSMLILIGSAALLVLMHSGTELLTLVAALVLLIIPVVLFLNTATFTAIQRLGSQFGHLGQRIFAADGWLAEMRVGMCQLSPLSALLAMGLTVLAYGIFFAQCYLLALALDISLSYIQVSYAVAIGSLVTLLPISVSGLGTREVAMIAYLSTVGVTPEQALGFSLLVFATFYLAGGLLGAVAWWIKPVPLPQTKQT